MRTVADEAVTKLMENGWDVSKVDIDNLAFENNVSITVVDESYEILATTRINEISRGALGERTLGILKKEKETPQESGRSFYSNFDDGTGRISFIQIDTIPHKGYVLIRKSVYGFQSGIRVMEQCYVISASMIFVLSIFLLIYMSGKMVKPLQEINRVTGQIANLNFDEKLEVAEKDEIGELAESVNLMSDKLKENMEKLKGDVEMRKALVRNMAHELKTPVAVIMGYAENMGYIVSSHPDKVEKYCRVIAEECGRMDSLILQMLEFSAYENVEEAFHKTHFEVARLLGSMRNCFKNEFPDRNTSYIEEDYTTGPVYGDPDAIQRALYNFVKNAVSYGRADGIIRVTIRETEDAFVFSVFNQGNPIPEKEAEKIWEVFYKINSARTRDSHRGGIGLSIVKQVALGHGGETGVVNRADGVEFFFSTKK